MQKEAIERIKSAPDALKKFKPVKKASDTKKASRLFGAAESCDLAINALLSCPDTASQGEDFKKRFMALYGEVDAAIKENAAQHKDIANTLKAMTRATMSAISKATEKEAA
jgi:hypothetical protein